MSRAITVIPMPLPELAEHVARTDVLAADGADVDPARASGQVGERDRPEQVRDDDDEELGHGSTPAWTPGARIRNRRRRAMMK